MLDVILGVLAVVVGLLLCFRGHGAMRVLLAIWGAFVGFGLGGVLIATLTDQGYLATALGWVAAIVLAAVFAALAYLFFAVAVVLAFTSMGFVLGGTLASVLGASTPWLVGVLGGLALGALAIATNLPQLFLIVISAFAGASVAITGLMLLLGVTDRDDLVATEVPVINQPLWFVGQLILAVLGIILQVRHTRQMRRAGTMRQAWSQPAAS